jgi:hypothetical protein
VRPAAWSDKGRIVRFQSFDECEAQIKKAGAAVSTIKPLENDVPMSVLPWWRMNFPARTILPPSVKHCGAYLCCVVQ